MRVGVLPCVTALAWMLSVCVVVANSNQRLLVEANSKFALSLYNHVSTDGANVVISPYSVSAAMAMTFAGSSGRTYAELRKVLGYTRMRPWFVHRSFRNLLRKQRRTSADYKLYVANRIFADRKIRIRYSYQRMAMRYYGSSVKILRFDSRPDYCVRYINRWISRKTSGMISNMLDRHDVDRYTNLVLASAIYFKSNWKIPFDTAETVPDTFYLTEGHTMQVDMMIKRAVFRYGISKQLGCHVVELPYKGDASMYIFLPWAVDGLSAMQKKITLATLNAAIGSLKNMLTNVYLPRFTLTSDVDLRQALTEMGVFHLFQAANLRRISTSAALAITRVKHSATIKVNERGTEASAATSFVSTRSFGQPFIADRPFAFIIRERWSGSILFMGHVKKPPRATTMPVGGFPNRMRKKTDMLMKRIMHFQRNKYKTRM